MYSVVVDAEKKTCSVEADMPNEGGSAGECRYLGGMAYAVAKCPVGRVPVGLACVAVDDDDRQSTPVRGTTQAVLLHTAQCGFPHPFPPPFGGARAAIIMACQPVELSGSDIMRRRAGALPASVEELLRKVDGSGRQRAMAAAAAQAAAGAEAAKQKAAPPKKVAHVVTVTPTPAVVVMAAPKDVALQDGGGKDRAGKRKTK